MACFQAKQRLPLGADPGQEVLDWNVQANGTILDGNEALEPAIGREQVLGTHLNLICPR